MQTNEFQIWGDNEVESEWFQSLSNSLLDSEIKTIGARGSNSNIVDELVRYDRPDIILLKKQKPILVLEKTREVPTGHNIGQRVARLVRAAEHGVPVVYFLPFDARKHGKHSGICSINTRLFKAMLRMSEIHEVPIIPINWPVDEDGELIIDGTENIEVKEVLDNLISNYPHIDFSYFNSKRLQLEEEMVKRNRKHPPYELLPNSVEICNTNSFFASLEFRIPNNLSSRDKSMVYTIDMSPDKCRREDPYTGMQFIYDYGWLRQGPKPANREINLLLHIPRVTSDVWVAANPNDPLRKSCNWYLIADAIVLKDKVIDLVHK